MLIFGEKLFSFFIHIYNFSIVVELEKMNTALQDFLNDVQELCQEMAPEPSVAAMLAPSHLREKCRQEAADMIARHNSVNDREPGKMSQLVTDLTALMLQVKVIWNIILNVNTYCFIVIQSSLRFRVYLIQIVMHMN